MIPFRATITLEVELDTFTEQDAVTALEDCFGEGEQSGLSVVGYKLENLDVRNTK